ncbi:hemerythrin-like metal-binding domain protein [Halovenus aranensis]|uniref:Hemerythrin-like metal-binding domain protein n=1 Tax=Halovenus aranensis TaxID=890420 RepID=A0A1G8VDG2_9EURY|nr:bacteriohemerythrin [Halovenus aranensis]SDJ63375.1 hemerythrin-like metal-binding domain protein [Halovenus aranensis]
MATGSEGNFIEWDDERYSTDIERFDKQHQQLFKLLNELHVAMNKGESDDEIRRILVELERYTEYHFGDEEEFMQDCGFSMDCADCFYNHKEKHAEFAEKVTDLRQKHEAGEYITMEVLMFVRDWLDSHIAGMNQDQNYSEYYHDEIPDDYEYSPGKLKKDRDVEAAHPEALQDASMDDHEVSLASDIHDGGSLSIPDEPVAAWFDRTAQTYDDEPAVRPRNPADTETQTFAQFRERARKVAAGLLEQGLGPGDRVGIYAEPCYKWSVVDMACHLAGLVSVPVSTLYSEGRALHVIDDAGVDVLVAEPTLPVVLERQVDGVIPIEDLPAAEPDGLPGFDRKESNVATIVYKLGTDKHPRGCALTNRNLLGAVQMFAEELPLGAGSVGTCFLPMAHIYQRVAAYYLWHTGGSVAYMDADALDEQLPAARPDVMVGVPQGYERLCETIQDRMTELSGARKLVAGDGDVARAYGERMREGESASMGLSLKQRMAERTVFPSLREEFGLDDLEYALTGTNSIDDDVLHFFWGLGVPVREIYESTELTGLATITEPEDYRADVVGSPFPGTEIALAEDGEILLRGQNVMDGYWDDEDATAYAIRDGWYHTGDLGEFADDGALRVTGRK